MALIEGASLGGHALHVVKQYAEENALARERANMAAGTEEFGGGCLRGRYNNLREIQFNPSLVVVPSLTSSGALFVQRPVCRTNYLPNNTMVGATGSVLPSGWSIGSVPAGITVAYSASGTAVAADGVTVNYIDFTFSGTAGASGFLNLRPNASPSLISAISGQTWTASVYLSLTSGSVTSVSPTYQLQEQTSADAFLNGSNITGLASLTSTLQRYQVTRLLSESTTAKVQVRWGHSIVSGTAYNYTIRIASPQLERLGGLTGVIPTASGAVTVLNNTTNVVGLPPDFTVTRATTATRVNSSGLIESVASGVPRIDWLGQSCPALLVEASGTNLVQRSEDFSNVYWNRVNCVVSGDLAIAPDGNLTADKLIMNNGILPNAANQSGFNRSETITSGTYRFSVFAKAAEFTGFRVRENLTTGAFLDVNLTNGAITNGDVTQFINPLAENYGNGWYRISWTSPTITSLTKYSIRVGSTGDGTSGIFVWGAQVEAGTVATTYIPTTTAAVTRNADVINASGALVSGLIGHTEGTIYAEVNVRSFSSTDLIAGTIVTIGDGTSSNRLQIYKQNDGRIGCERVSPTQSTFTAFQSNVYTAPITLKIAVAYKSGDTIMYINGVAATSQQTQTFTFNPLTKINIGSNRSDANQLNDRIRAAALYTTRLSNDELAQLTT